MTNFWDYGITQGFGPTDEPLDSGYGGYANFNKGNDYAVPSGTPIKANVAGKVISAGDTGDGWGVRVWVQDANGLIHNYGHLSGANVQIGQTVTPGMLLGTSGNTGKSTGPHLSYDVWTFDKNGPKYVDPTPFVGGGGGSTRGTTAPTTNDPMGPAGRTYSQTTGTEYKSDAEREWYLGQQGRAVPGGGGTMNQSIEEIAAAAVREALAYPGSSGGFASPATGTGATASQGGAVPTTGAPTGGGSLAGGSTPAAGAPQQTERIPIPGGGYMQFVPEVGDYIIMKPRVHPLTGAVVPGEFDASGWRSAAPGQEGTKPDARSLTYDQNGNAFLLDSRTGALEAIPTLNKAEGAAKGPQGSATRDELAGLKATFSGSLARVKNADGTTDVYERKPDGNYDYIKTDAAKTTPERPLSAAEKAALSSQRARQILEGKTGDQLSQTATSTNAAPDAAPALGATRDPKLIYAPDNKTKGELAGMEFPTDINGSQGSYLYNPSQAVGSLFTAGLVPTGNKEADMQTALGIDALRAQKLASGMSPEAVQREFDANISLGQRNAQADYAQRFGMGGSTMDMGPSKGGVGMGAKTTPISAGTYSSLLNPNQELSELDKLLLFGGMANGGSVTAGVRGFAEGGSIDVENQASYYNDPSIGWEGAGVRRNYDANPWIFELPMRPPGPSARADQPAYLSGSNTSMPSLTRALQAAGAPPALISAGIGGIMRLPPHMRDRILGPMAQEYFSKEVTYQPAFSDPRSQTYQGTLIDMWNDVLEGNLGRMATKGPAQRTPITIDEGGVYRTPGMGPVQRFTQPGSPSDYEAGFAPVDPNAGPDLPTVPRPPVTPPVPVVKPYTGPAQLPYDAYRELGISSVQPWPPVPGSPPAFGYGGEMTTQEPIVGMGAMSGQPQFVVGEAGPERLDVTPLTGPNAGMYAGGVQQPQMQQPQARMESGYEGTADYGAMMSAPYKTRRPVPLLDPVAALRRMRTAA